MDEDQGIERDEGSRAQGLNSAGRREARGECGQGENRDGGECLHRPYGCGDRQPGQRVSQQGEEGPIGTCCVGPGDLGKGGVRRCGSGAADVGIDPVYDAEAGVVDVAINVVRKQRGKRGEAEEQDRDRGPDHSRPERGSRHTGTKIGGEADPHEGIGRPCGDAQLTAPVTARSAVAKAGSATSPA